MLVVAGAGSGKTRVLTRRIAHLLGAVGASRPRSWRSRSRTRRPARCASASATSSAARARRVGDDVPLRVRPDPAARGRAARLPLELHDLRPGRPDAARQALPRGARARPEALHAARHPLPDLEREEQLVGPEEYTERVASFDDQTVAESTTCTRSASSPRTRSTSTTCSSSRRLLERFPEARTKWQTRSATSSSTSTRTRTTRSTACSAARREHRNLFVVGDPDQSIYASAAPTSATSSSSSATSRARTSITLEQNYRSTRTSSTPRTASSATTASARRRSSGRSSARATRCASIEVEDEHAEARYVAAEIALLVEEGYSGARSRSSTARTRRAACSRTSSCGRASRTR